LCCERMRKKVLLGLFLIRFEGGIEDGLEIGRRCRRRWNLRHGKSNTDELVNERETEMMSRHRGTSDGVHSPGVGLREHGALLRHGVYPIQYTDSGRNMFLCRGHWDP